MIDLLYNHLPDLCFLPGKFPRRGTGSTCRGEGVNTVRRNSVYGLRVAKSPLWAFVLLPIFRPTIVVLLVCCSTYFLFLQHFLQFLVLSVLFPTSSPKILLNTPSPAYFLSHPSTLFSHVLPFPPVFPYPVLPFVPVLPMFVPHFPSQNPVEHARSRSLLQRTSFLFPLPFPHVLSCIVDFTSIVSEMCFSSLFVPLGFSWKMSLYLTIRFLVIWSLFIQCCSFCFDFDTSAVSVCIFVFI